MAVIANPVELAVAVEIGLTPPLYLWTGSETEGGNLAFGGKTYLPGGILGVSEADVSKQATNEALTLSLSAVTAEERNRWFGADPGPQEVTIRSLWRERTGGAWTAWAEAFSAAGVLSTPAANDEVLSIEIAHTLDDVDRGVKQYLSDTAQRNRFPNDEGLYMLARHGGEEIAVSWPA